MVLPMLYRGPRSSSHQTFHGFVNRSSVCEATRTFLAVLRSEALCPSCGVPQHDTPKTARKSPDGAGCGASDGLWFVATCKVFLTTRLSSTLQKVADRQNSRRSGHSAVVASISSARSDSNTHHTRCLTQLLQLSTAFWRESLPSMLLAHVCREAVV